MAESFLRACIRLAQEGTQASVSQVLARLGPQMTLAESKCIDFALSHVQTLQGVEAMEHALFHGTPIQRNYCALYFARRGDYDMVRKAYDCGLIDARQAFSR